MYDDEPMRHARDDALDRLEELLGALRERAHLRERSRGTFYRGSRAFLHFHEHAEGLFADLKLEGSWQRFPCRTRREQRALLGRVDGALSA